MTSERHTHSTPAFLVFCLQPICVSKPCKKWEPRARRLTLLSRTSVSHQTFTSVLIKSLIGRKLQWGAEHILSWFFCSWREFVCFCTCFVCVAHTHTHTHWLGFCMCVLNEVKTLSVCEISSLCSSRWRSRSVHWFHRIDCLYCY